MKTKKTIWDYSNSFFYIVWLVIAVLATIRSFFTDQIDFMIIAMIALVLAGQEYNGKN